MGLSEVKFDQDSSSFYHNTADNIVYDDNFTYQATIRKNEI